MIGTLQKLGKHVLISRNHTHVKFKLATVEKNTPTIGPEAGTKPTHVGH